MPRPIAGCFVARCFLVCLCLGAAAAACGATRARAQNCEALSGPARTDCFIGQARISGQQSGIAAGAARVRASEERLRAVTGGVYVPKSHRAKSHHKVRSP